MSDVRSWSAWSVASLVVWLGGIGQPAFGQDLRDDLDAIKYEVQLDAKYLPPSTRSRIDTLYGQAAREIGQNFSNTVQCQYDMRYCLETIDSYIAKRFAYTSTVSQLHWTLVTYLQIRAGLISSKVDPLHIPYTPSQRKTALGRKTPFSQRLAAMGEAYADYLGDHAGKPVIEPIQNELKKLTLSIFDEDIMSRRWYQWSGICEGMADCRRTMYEYQFRDGISWWWNDSLSTRQARLTSFKSALLTMDEMAHHRLVEDAPRVTSQQKAFLQTLADLPLCNGLATNPQIYKAEENQDEEFSLLSPDLTVRSLIAEDNREAEIDFSSTRTLTDKRLQYLRTSSKSVGGCFAQGTGIYVRSARSSGVEATSIDQVQPGDFVLSYLSSSDHVTVGKQRVCWDRVTHTYARRHQGKDGPVFRVGRPRSEALTVTAGHRFLVQEDPKGPFSWKRAKDLDTSSDRLFSLGQALSASDRSAVSGQAIPTKGLLFPYEAQWNYLVSPETVHNLRTEMNHKYFIGIGPESVLVHNVK